MRKGQKHTLESKKKLSESHKGNVGFWTGKKRGQMSQEWKDNISKSLKGKMPKNINMIKGWGKGEKRPELAKRYTKEGNPNWIDGRARRKYPAIFNSTLKAEIRERDDNKCQLCHRSNEWCKEQYGKTLSVNHIDFNKENCDKSNLNTLCNFCNAFINKKSRRALFTRFFSEKLLINSK